MPLGSGPGTHIRTCGVTKRHPGRRVRSQSGVPVLARISWTILPCPVRSPVGRTLRPSSWKKPSRRIVRSTPVGGLQRVRGKAVPAMDVALSLLGCERGRADLLELAVGPPGPAHPAAALHDVPDRPQLGGPRPRRDQGALGVEEAVWSPLRAVVTALGWPHAIRMGLAVGDVPVNGVRSVAELLPTTFRLDAQGQAPHAILARAKGERARPSGRA